MRHSLKHITLVFAVMLALPVAAKGERFVFTTIWTAQAQFAGYYAAKEKGFYDEMGLDVVIQHPSLTSSASNRLKTDQCDAAMFSMMSAMDFIRSACGHLQFRPQLPNLYNE